jgi:hypothetical protein
MKKNVKEIHTFWTFTHFAGGFYFEIFPMDLKSA